MRRYVWMIILQVKSIHKDLYDYYAIRLSRYITTMLYNVGFGIQTLRRFFKILFVVQGTFNFISNLFHILLFISIVQGDHVWKPYPKLSLNFQRNIFLTAIIGKNTSIFYVITLNLYHSTCLRAKLYDKNYSWEIEKLFYSALYYLSPEVAVSHDLCGWQAVIGRSHC